MKKINIGLDVHGTLDDNPELFMKLIQELKFLGYNVIVHIITGKRYSERMEAKLKCMHSEHKKWWDRYFSVETHLLNLGTLYVMDKEVNRPIFCKYTWNSIKSNYCKFFNITLMIEDTYDYIKYFTTPYIHYQGSISKDKYYIKLAITLIKSKVEKDDKFRLDFKEN